MPGNNTVIMDSDGLIGLFNKTDALHNRCVLIARFLNQFGFTTFTPYHIVLEAATALTRDKQIKGSTISNQLLHDFASNSNDLFTLEVEKIVAQLYDPNTSKKNSPFDYFVLACARKNNIPYVFSFDSFYKKHGLALIEEIAR